MLIGPSLFSSYAFSQAKPSQAKLNQVQFGTSLYKAFSLNVSFDPKALEPYQGLSRETLMKKISWVKDWGNIPSTGLIHVLDANTPCNLQDLQGLALLTDRLRQSDNEFFSRILKEKGYNSIVLQKSPSCYWDMYGVKNKEAGLKEPNFKEPNFLEWTPKSLSPWTQEFSRGYPNLAYVASHCLHETHNNTVKIIP